MRHFFHVNAYFAWAVANHTDDLPLFVDYFARSWSPSTIYLSHICYCFEFLAMLAQAMV
jgi:hypothetical protein